MQLRLKVNIYTISLVARPGTKAAPSTLLTMALPGHKVKVQVGQCTMSLLYEGNTRQPLLPSYEQMANAAREGQSHPSPGHVGVAEAAHKSEFTTVPCCVPVLDLSLYVSMGI